MRTSDLFKTSANKLNESLGKTFGRKIDFSTFDGAKLEDARNKLRTQVHQIRSESGFNENIDNDAYHEAQWMLDAINAELAEREELLANGGTAEVEEETSIEGMDEVHDHLVKLARNIDDGDYGDMWGDPDINKVMSLVQAGKIEAAAEEFVNAYTDQDGGESREADNMYADLVDDLKYMTSQEEGIGDQIGAAAHKLWKGDKQEKPAVVTAPAKEPTKHKETPLMPPEHDDTQDEGILDNMWKASKQAVRHGIDPDADWDKIDSDHEMVTSLQDAGYSDKEIKMAYGILNDPRYKQGNLTGALAKIEKIAPGMADEPAFQKVMKATQESIDLGEEMNNLTEGEIQQASAIVTAKTMVDRVGRWIEELSGMENETLLQLGDSIRDEMSQEQSKAFIEAASPAIQQALENLKTTRESLASAIRQLTGEEAATGMLGDEPAEGGAEDMAEPAPEMGAEVPAEDEFAAAEPAAGGMETAGREQRESIDRQNNLMKILAG
jgi:hypothetical protein